MGNIGHITNILKRAEGKLHQKTLNNMPAARALTIEITDEKCERIGFVLLFDLKKKEKSIKASNLNELISFFLMLRIINVSKIEYKD